MGEDWQSGIAVCFLVLRHVLLCSVTKTCDGSSADLSSECKTWELKARELEFTSLRERMEVWVMQSPPQLSGFGLWPLEPAASR